MTSSTSAFSIPALLTASWIIIPPNLVAPKPLSVPPKEPSGVRTALTMTASRLTLIRIPFILLFDSYLSTLDRIKCGSFDNIVRDHPDIQTIRYGVILTNTAHQSDILPSCECSQWILVAWRIVHHLHARGMFQKLTRLFRPDFLFCLYVQRFRVAEKSRHPDGGSCHLDGRIQYLLRLPHHFHLFFGVAILQEDINVGQTLEGNAVRVHIRRHGTVRFQCLPQRIQIVVFRPLN